MMEIPLRATANQTLQTIVGDQNCSIRLYTRLTPLGDETIYMDLAVDQTNIFTGEPCMDGLPLPLYDYVQFTGKLMFIDLQGSSAPQYYGLGSRWVLVYMDNAEQAQYREGTAYA